VTHPLHDRLTVDVGEAVAVLRGGGLVGLPTETVYGLAADASRRDSIARVFESKGRPTDHPLIVHVAGPSQIDRWARDVPPHARLLVDRWWPGPLTLLLWRSAEVVDEVTGGRDTVALRCPAHPMARQVLEEFDGGLVAPSANRFGRVSPTSATDVLDELGEEVDLVLDGGACEVGVESTIVDLTGQTPVVVRRGGVTPEEIAEVLGVEVEVAGDGATVVAPGMLASHYAPDARLVVLAPDVDDARVVAEVADHLVDDRGVGVLAPRRIEGLPFGAVELDPAGGPDDYARVLYSRLREADAREFDLLVVVPPPADGIGAAVHDRLARAAHR
jgi:L-threonylcarbamoyladenylate synthase